MWFPCFSKVCDVLWILWHLVVVVSDDQLGSVFQNSSEWRNFAASEVKVILKNARYYSTLQKLYFLSCAVLFKNTKSNGKRICCVHVGPLALYEALIHIQSFAPVEVCTYISCISACRRGSYLESTCCNFFFPRKKVGNQSVT